MSTTRSVRPTDLVALVALDGRVYLNEARTWDRLGRQPEGPRLLDSAMVPWFSFATGRHTCISIRGQTIRGLVSARRRGNRSAWEIDCLIVATDEQDVITDLFDQLTAIAGHAGALKIFLRLDAGSALLAPARRAGFVPYAEERLYRTDKRPVLPPLPDGFTARPYRAADAFSLYRLYMASVPEAVRRVEAPTFQQWLAMAERRASGRAGCDYVVCRKDETVARVRACRERDLAKVDLAVHPSASAALPGLLDLGCGQAGNKRPIFCLVPAYAEALERQLQEAEFELDSEYVLLTKRTAFPLVVAAPAKARLAPAHPLATV